VTDSFVPAALTDLLADRPWLVAVVAGVVLLALRLLGRAGRPSARAGEVWFAQVPFRDGTGSKDRPVVVLSQRGRTCTVARLTSQDNDHRPEYVRAPAVLPGLRRPSWVDLRPMRIPRTALRRRTGDAGRAWVAWYDEARRADS
jgi:mRNA-degrading endonuclease toxin of MazEF toxin-antitoxin module